MLPGKLCIGILEEDNPLKSYFRLKPLIYEENGSYLAFEGGDAYPDDGCIRIVPDKNESSHFKARMRRMGRYCVLDLREHAGANDKIRPNKNYKNADGENNAYIIYSDVVREPAENMIFEICPALPEGEAVHTPRILIGDQLETWRCIASDAEEENAELSFERDGACLCAQEIQKFDLAGFREERVCIAVKRPDAIPSVIGEPAPILPPHPKAVYPARVAEEALPAAPKEEKPWISRDFPTPPPRAQHLSSLEQKLAAQSGLNPRRSRSLQEIIEEKWRHSRVDQLGHPIPVNAMGQPVENPVEHAVRALKGAWEKPEIRAELLGALSEIEDFSASLDERKRLMGDLALKHELEELEAERLKTLSEIDRLRQQKSALRESFKQEIREEEAEALKEYTEGTLVARREYEKFRAEAEAAHKDADMARDAFAALSDGRFEQKLRDHVLLSRAAELLREGDAEIVSASDETPDAEQWIERMRLAFAEENLELGRAEAANLLVCLALNSRLILSGAACSDKAGYARAIARALGAADCGRYAEIGVKDEKEDFCAEDGLPYLAYVRRANARRDGDIFCGASAEDVITIAEAVDAGGYPLSAEDVEQAFLLRLECADSDAPWQCAPRQKTRFTPVRMQALRQAFCVEAKEMPAALDLKMKKLRQELGRFGAKLSRNTLDQLWRYCAAMLSLNCVDAEEALDWAFAQRALPCLLAEAPFECLKALPRILADMPRCHMLLKQPLPILI